MSKMGSQPPQDIRRIERMAGRGARVYPGDSVAMMQGAGGNAVAPADTHCLPGEVKALTPPAVWVLDDGGAPPVKTVYTPGSLVRNVANTHNYRCLLGHTAAAINQPDVGADWADFWIEVVSTYECYVYPAELGTAAGVYPIDNVWPVFIDDSVCGELDPGYRGLLSFSYTGDWFMYPYDALAEAAVLRGTASANHSFHAINTSAQNFASGVGAQVLFQRDTPVASPTDDWLHDDGGNYDTTTSEYTVPTSGYYKLEAQISVEYPMADTVWVLTLEYSPDAGANWYSMTISNLTDMAGAGSYTEDTITVVGNYVLDKGDLVRVWALQWNGPAAVHGVVHYNRSHFSGSMLYALGGGGGVAVYPKRGLMLHRAATVLAGNAMTSYCTAAYNYDNYTVQIPAANNDSFSHGCFLRAGTYTFEAWGTTSNNRGKIDWTLDGNVIVAGQDWYSAAATGFVVKTVAAHVVATDGWHRLVGTVNGKNGASSNFFIALHVYWFKQVPD